MQRKTGVGFYGKNGKFSRNIPKLIRRHTIHLCSRHLLCFYIIIYNDIKASVLWINMTMNRTNDRDVDALGPERIFDFRAIELRSLRGRHLA